MDLASQLRGMLVGLFVGQNPTRPVQSSEDQESFSAPLDDDDDDVEPAVVPAFSEAALQRVVLMSQAGKLLDTLDGISSLLSDEARIRKRNTRPAPLRTSF